MLEKIFYKGLKKLFPSEIIEGQVLYAEDENGLYLDNESTRDRINPPSDWNETDESSPSFIANKPELYDVMNQKSAYPYEIDGVGSISYVDGSILESSVLSHTNYVDVSNCNLISYKRVQMVYPTTNVGIAFYDESQNFISGITSLTDQSDTTYVDELHTITIPDGAKYARFSCFTDITTHGDFELYGYSLVGIGNVLDSIQTRITDLENNTQTADTTLLNQLDGTPETYRRVMRQWFQDNGVEYMNSTSLTELCEKWYTLTRDGWDGYTEFAQPDVSAVSTGTKGGDNEGLTCVPSTDTVANQDDYAGLPLFACVDVNYVVDSNCEILITAIDGITDNFDRNSPDRYVGVMQMAGYHYWYETDTVYVHGYADHEVSVENGECAPLPESVRIDGRVSHFVVHSKYMNHTTNGKLTSYSGAIPTAYISHDSCHTLSKVNGAQYSGSTSVDLAFLTIMTYIKYASLTLDEIMQGCIDFNGQYYAQITESGVKRVIVPKDAMIEEGCTVYIGTYSGNTDRGASNLYSVSTNSGVVVTGVEAYTVNGTEYKAVYVNTSSTFNTVANGNAASGSTIISTFHWKTGTTDGVLGNDGSYKDNTSGKYPYKLQGIEVMNGGYEVLADVILNIASSKYTPYVVNRSASQSTAITSNYKALTNLVVACPSADGWQYVKRLKFQDGMFFQSVTGGSSSTYTRDAFYMNKSGTTATREYLAFGYLFGGSGHAGLFCLNGVNALSNGHWYCLARLSPNGNRG